MSKGKKEGATLRERQARQTRELILDAAIEILESPDFRKVTARAVARRSGIAERTIFRHYSSRDEFLSAVAHAVAGRLASPPPPRDARELQEYPTLLFKSFEKNVLLLKSVLRSEVYPHVRRITTEARWSVIPKILRALEPRASDRQVKMAAAQIRYMLSASTWNYYRHQFRFSPRQAVQAVEWAIEDVLNGFKRRAKANS